MIRLSLCLLWSVCGAVGWGTLESVTVDDWAIERQATSTIKSTKMTSAHDRAIGRMTFVLDNPSRRDITASVVAIDQNDQPWTLIDTQRISAYSVETHQLDIAALSGKSGYGMFGIKALRIEGQRALRPDYLLLYDIAVGAVKPSANRVEPTAVHDLRYGPTVMHGEVWQLNFDANGGVSKPFADHGIYARVVSPGGGVSRVAATLTRLASGDGVPLSYRWVLFVAGEKTGRYSLRVFYRGRALSLPVQPGGGQFIDFTCEARAAPPVRAQTAI